MHKNSIQSLVHPDEYTQTLKTGLPWGILGIAIGLAGQLWLKPDPFSLIGFSAFGVSIACLIGGFRKYVKLKLSDRFPTIIEWDAKALYIMGNRAPERMISFRNISECTYLNRTITLKLVDNQIITAHNFSERAASKLTTAIQKKGVVE